MSALLKGSCLCGSVSFNVSGPILGVGSCHCSKCRKVSGTAGNAQFVVPVTRFQWISGQDEIKSFRLPDGWGPSRCAECGSPSPESYDGGKQMWVPAGLMDDPLDTNFKLHIFCGSRADWDKESPAAKHFHEYPE